MAIFPCYAEPDELMDNRHVIEREQPQPVHRRGDTFAQEYVGPECEGWWDAWCRVCGQVPGKSFPSCDEALAWRCNQDAEAIFP